MSLLVRMTSRNTRDGLRLGFAGVAPFDGAALWKTPQEAFDHLIKSATRLGYTSIQLWCFDVSPAIADAMERVTPPPSITLRGGGRASEIIILGLVGDQ